MQIIINSHIKLFHFIGQIDIDLDDVVLTANYKHRENSSNVTRKMKSFSSDLNISTCFQKFY